VSERPSFAEVATVELDRVLRHLEVLRDLVRDADEYLLSVAAPPVERPPVRVVNRGPQSVRVDVAQGPTGVVVVVTHRGDEDVPHLIPSQRDQVFEA
jgi:hypothetical protein